jgi:hypothetical protein
MGNVMTGNIWKIDTAASLRTDPLYVHKMWWKPAASGDTILIKDAGGNEIWDYYALAGDSNLGITFEWPGQPGVLNGINVATLDDGELYIQIN